MRDIAASLRHAMPLFELITAYTPQGDQPQAIAELTEGIERRDRFIPRPLSVACCAGAESMRAQRSSIVRGTHDFTIFVRHGLREVIWRAVQIIELGST